MGNDSSVPANAEGNVVKEQKVTGDEIKRGEGSILPPEEKDPKNEESREAGDENKEEEPVLVEKEDSAEKQDSPGLEKEQEKSEPVGLSREREMPTPAITEKDSSPEPIKLESNDVKEEEEQDFKEEAVESEDKTLDLEESVVLVPAVPIENDERFSWDTINVERQTQHYLFLLGMVLALGELADGVSEERCTSEKLIDAFKGLSPAVTAQDMLNIALLCKDETDMFEQDPRRAERPYPINMLQEWQSWISSGQGLLTNDMVVHTMQRQNQVLCAICVSEETNSVTVVLGYHRDSPNPMGAGTRSYDIERDTGRSVGVDATWGDVLSGTRDNDSTLSADILQEIAKHKLSPPVRLAVVGYGGGGALATVLGFVLAAAKEEPIHVWSFGAPAVGDARFQRTHARLEAEGKLRHVRVEDAPRPSFSGQYYHVGVPLELHSNDFNARPRNEVPPEMSKTYSEAPSLAACSPASAAQEEDNRLAGYWHRLLSLKSSDESLEDWYQNSPTRKRVTNSKTKKRFAVLVALIISLIYGVIYYMSLIQAGAPREEKIVQFSEQVHTAERATLDKENLGEDQIVNASSDFELPDSVRETVVAEDHVEDQVTLDSNDTLAVEEVDEEDTDKPADKPSSTDGEEEAAPVASKETTDLNDVQDELDSNDALAVEEEEAERLADELSSTATGAEEEAPVTAEETSESGDMQDKLDSNDTLVAVEEPVGEEIRVQPTDDLITADEAEATTNDALAMEEAVEEEIGVQPNDLITADEAEATPVVQEESTNALHSVSDSVNESIQEEEPVEQQEGMDSDATVDVERQVQKEEPDHVEETRSTTNAEEAETVQVAKEEPTYLSENASETNVSSFSEPVETNEHPATQLSEPPRPLPTRFFNMGKAFSKRSAILPRASSETQQWVSSLVASHALKNESRHVVEGWEARYWYNKHYSQYEALEAVKHLHGELVSSIEM